MAQQALLVPPGLLGRRDPKVPKVRKGRWDHKVLLESVGKQALLDLKGPSGLRARKAPRAPRALRAPQASAATQDPKALQAPPARQDRPSPLAFALLQVRKH